MIFFLKLVNVIKVLYMLSMNGASYCSLITIGHGSSPDFIHEKGNKSNVWFNGDMVRTILATYMIQPK